MKIVDLTGLQPYLEEDVPPADRSDLLPNLIEHYTRYVAPWPTADDGLATEAIIPQRNRVFDTLQQSIPILNEAGLNNERLIALLMVGQARSNGHAYLDHGYAIAWFDIRCYDKPSTATIFSMHELIHAIHYQQDPQFYFNTQSERRNTERQLLTEGVATYCTKRLLGVSDVEALWGDELPPDASTAWLRECNENVPQLSHRLKSAISANDADDSLFLARNPNDPFGYRQGYYLGLRLIEQVSTELAWSPLELLMTPKSTLAPLVRRHLRRLQK